MGSFGEDLKKAREAKGVAIEAIAAATKISTRYLQSVEQEQFDQLPGGVFRRSIVRSYARTAGLDEEEWVRRYLEVSHENVGPTEEDQAWMAFAENVGRARGGEAHANSSMARWAGVVALLLLVIGMSWFVWGYVHNKAAAASKSARVSSSALTTQAASAAVSY
jgi:cytoskeleton protein RodZ